MISTRLLKSVFSALVRGGSLMVIGADGRRMCFGDGSAAEVVVRFADARAQWAMLFDRDRHIGGLFSEGRLIVERGTIYDFLSLIHTARAPSAAGWLGGLAARLQRALPGRRGGGDEPQASGDDLFALFLDPDWQYSCAYFEHPGQALADAQGAKKRHIAAKLLIGPNDRVLDIGCGWGGLACYLAQTAQAASVFGVSISPEQVAGARRRAEVRGLDGRTAFDVGDHRGVSGAFERIVTVGVLETLDASAQGRFFETCRDRLTDDGVMLLQTVAATGAGGLTNPPIGAGPFAGQPVVALSRTLCQIERAGLVVTDVEVLRLHQADTLRAWRKAFIARRKLAVERFGERFARSWEYHLSVCETAFRLDDVAVVQIQIARRADTVPLTRDYVAVAEQRLRLREQAGDWVQQSAVLHS